MGKFNIYKGGIRITSMSQPIQIGIFKYRYEKQLLIRSDLIIGMCSFMCS